MIPSYPVIIADKPIEEVTMAEAVAWMNEPKDFAERIERRFLLKQYIGASINLKPLNLISSGEGG